MLPPLWGLGDVEVQIGATGRVTMVAEGGPGLANRGRSPTGPIAAGLAAGDDAIELARSHHSGLTMLGSKSK